MMKTTALLFVASVMAYCPGRTHAAAYFSQPLSVQELPIGNLLTWETVLEVQVAHFIVEKSADGKFYYELGTVAGSGFSMIDKQYHFMDVGTSDVKNYYRLREVDFDGTVFSTLPVLLEKELPNNMHVMAISNPDVKKVFKVTLDVARPGAIQCVLANFSGKVLQEFVVQASSGLTEVTINMEDFPAGIYSFKLKQAAEVESFLLRRVEDEITSRPQVASRKKSEYGRQK